MSFVRGHIVSLAIGGALVLAGASGAFAAVALTSSSQQAPTKTVTINAGEGATGPSGPAGPAGPPGPKGDPGAGGGAESCPVGSSFQSIVINSPGGHTEFWTCVVG